jgi:hypothetical protein
MRPSHHIESAGRSQSQVPISAELNARFSRSCSLLTRAFLMREWGRRLFSRYFVQTGISRKFPSKPTFFEPPWMRNRAAQRSSRLIRPTPS